jgi:cell division protein FtsB
MTIDANSILVALMTVLLGLSGWTLYTLHGLSNQAAGAVEKEKAQDEQIKQVRARVINVERDVRDLELQVAPLGLPRRRKED